MKKAIVTGATGFIGSHLCKYLLRNSWDVSIISRMTSNYSKISEIEKNLTVYEYNGDINELIHFFNSTNADVVFHLASLFIDEHVTNQVDSLLDSNIKFGTHILEAMKFSNTKILINTGTSWQHFENHEYNPVNLYAATKQAFSSLVKYYTEAENIRTITLKLFDTYGEFDIRPKLINILHTIADEKRELKMSPGNQVLDLVHVDDVVRAFVESYNLLISNNLLKNEEYGVGSGRKVRLKDLIVIFEEVTGKKIDVIFGGREYRRREVMELWHDYKTLPNWKCEITLEDGLKRYI